MKKVFLSDLHLGDGSASDDFHKWSELIGLFDKYCDAKIIILGDIFELWQARLDRIIWHNADIYDLLQCNNVICIYGNHDYLPFAQYINCDNTVWSETYEDGLIFAQHGHQHDVFNKYKNPLLSLKWPIGKYITLAIGGLERFLHRDADVWAEKQAKKYGFLWEAAKLQSMEKDAWQYVSGKMITIEGHTHKACLFRNAERFKDIGGIMVEDKRIYANCGAWVDDVHPTYILVDDNVIQLRDGLDYSVIKELEIK